MKVQTKFRGTQYLEKALKLGCLFVKCESASRRHKYKDAFFEYCKNYCKILSPPLTGSGLGRGLAVVQVRGYTAHCTCVTVSGGYSENIVICSLYVS